MKLDRTPLAERILLLCGITAPLLYIGTDIFLTTRWHAYSYLNQTVSELSAIGAPTRPFWVAISFLFNPLLIAFGIGVWKAAKQKISLRITGSLLVVWGILGFAWLFFPMHLRGAIGTPTDTMHLVMAGITVPLMIMFIGFGANARGKWFRLYSIVTIVAMVIFGAYTGLQAPRVAAQAATPGIGILERVSVYAPMLWMFVLASILFQTVNKKNRSYE